MSRKMMRHLAAVLLSICLTPNLLAAATVSRVWAVNDGEKMERDDLNHKSRASNSVWDGHGIKISGRRNEIIASS